MSMLKVFDDVNRVCRETSDSIKRRYDAMTAKQRNEKQTESASEIQSGKCCCVSYKACSVVLLIFSFLMTGLAAVVFTQFDQFFETALKDQMHLGPNGLVFPSWRVSELRTNMRVYFFNITNPNEVMLGDKPILKEIGPYTWKIYMDKFDIVFHSNYTLSYKEKKWYEFLPDQSVGTYNDLITTVNVPYAAVAQRIKSQSSFAKTTATLTLDTLGQNPLQQRTVGELTFKGYPDFLVMVAKAVENGQSDSGIGSIFGTSIRLAANLFLDTPEESNFGYFVDKNNTDDGVVTIFTGEDERRKINRVDVVNGRKELTEWSREKCNKIRGTMGHLRPPMNGEKPVEIFVSEMCRSLPLRFQKMSDYEGLSTMRFVAGKDTFNNSASDACFAGPRKLKNGVMDIGPCKKGAPLVLSFPHYLFADESHIDSVVGMNPNERKHQFYLESDPLTGVTVSVRARFQVGVVMERVHGLEKLKTVFEGNIPLFWEELQLEALPPTVFQLSLLRNLPAYAKRAAVGLVGLAIFVGIVSVFLAYRDWRNGRQMKVVPERTYPIERAYVNHVHQDEEDDDQQKQQRPVLQYPKPVGNHVRVISGYNNGAKHVPS